MADIWDRVGVEPYVADPSKAKLPLGQSKTAPAKQPPQSQYDQILDSDTTLGSLLRGLAATGGRTLSYANFAADKLGMDPVVDPKRIDNNLNYLEQRKEQIVEKDMSPTRKREVDAIKKEVEKAQGWDSVLPIAKQIGDTLIHPSEWTAQGVVENFSPSDPLNLAGIGAGSIIAKPAKSIIAKTLLGGAGGAAEGAVIGGAGEYASAVGRGQSNAEAQKAAIAGTVGGVLTGGVMGAGAGAMSKTASTTPVSGTDVIIPQNYNGWGGDAPAGLLPENGTIDADIYTTGELGFSRQSALPAPDVPNQIPYNNTVITGFEGWSEPLGNRIQEAIDTKRGNELNDALNGIIDTEIVDRANTQLLTWAGERENEILSETSNVIALTNQMLAQGHDGRTINTTIDNLITPSAEDVMITQLLNDGNQLPSRMSGLRLIPLLENSIKTAIENPSIARTNQEFADILKSNGAGKELVQVMSAAYASKNPDIFRNHIYTALQKNSDAFVDTAPIRKELTDQIRTYHEQQLRNEMESAVGGDQADMNMALIEARAKAMGITSDELIQRTGMRVDDLRYIDGNEFDGLMKEADQLFQVDMEKRYLSGDRVNIEAIRKDAEELPPRIRTYEEFDKIFKPDENGDTVAISKGGIEVAFNVRGAWEHFKPNKNTHFDSREQFSGAFVNTLLDPVAVVKEPHKSRDYVFYKPFKDDHGVYNMAAIKFSNGKFTYFDLQPINKVKDIIKATEGNTLYFKYRRGSGGSNEHTTSREAVHTSDTEILHQNGTNVKPTLKTANDTVILKDWMGLDRALKDGKIDAITDKNQPGWVSAKEIDDARVAIKNSIPYMEGDARIYEYRNDHGDAFRIISDKDGFRMYSDRFSGEGKESGGYDYTPQNDEARRLNQKMANISISDPQINAMAEFGLKSTGEMTSVIRMFKSADVSSMPHELFHVFERTFSDSERQAFDQAFANIESGTARSEAGAEGFVKWLSDGEAPTPELIPVFEKFRTWLRDLWETLMSFGVKTAEGEFKLTDAHRQFYRAIMGDQEAAKALFEPKEAPDLRSREEIELDIVNTKPDPDPVSTETLLEDVGEKIGGARKDLWKDRGLSITDLDTMSGGEAAKFTTKDNVLGKPDYVSLAESGIPPERLAMYKVIRDRLAAKPSKDGDASRRHYVEAMVMLKETFNDFLSGKIEAKQIENEMIAKTGYKTSRSYGYKDLDVDQKRSRDLLWSLFKGRSSPLSVSSRDNSKVREMISQGFPSIEPYRKVYDVLLLQTDPDVYGLHNMSTGYRRPLSDANGKRLEFSTKSDAYEHAKSLFEENKKKGTPDKPPLPKRPHLDYLVREGDDIRSAQDIGADDFMNRYGFRGVEFGNWAAKDERQKIVNHAYDSLHDLSQILGIPERAISLNGTLGMAFGARGSGGALAHYEPSKIVINMTKIKGAGALAHEWAHALDHYFGEIDRSNSYGGKSRGASGWMGNADRSNLRPEMKEAFAGVMEAIFKSDHKRAEVIRDYELRLEKAEAEGRNTTQLESWIMQLRNGDYHYGGQSSYYKEAVKLNGKSGDYWTRPTEMFARAFEAYIFDRIGDIGKRNDYLVHSVGGEQYAIGYKGNAYPVGMERQKINAAFDNLFRSMKSEALEDGNVRLYQQREAAERIATIMEEC